MSYPRRASVLILLLGAAVVAHGFLGCTPEVRPDPPEGVAFVYSGGQQVLMGHNHGALYLRLDCESCASVFALRSVVARNQAEVAQAYKGLDARINQLEAEALAEQE